MKCLGEKFQKRKCRERRAKKGKVYERKVSERKVSGKEREIMILEVGPGIKTRGKTG